MLRKWFGFCLFGHIFPTSSHPNVPPRSKEAIQQALNVPIPIYAIGGINEHSLQKDATWI